jgi:hypothetical protein
LVVVLRTPNVRPLTSAGVSIADVSSHSSAPSAPAPMRSAGVRTSTAVGLWIVPPPACQRIEPGAICDSSWRSITTRTLWIVAPEGTAAAKRTASDWPPSIRNQSLLEVCTWCSLPSCTSVLPCLLSQPSATA